MATITIAPGRRIGLTLPRLDAAGVLTGAVYLIFFALGFMSFTDPDYWWHLRTGQYIVDNQSIPTNDIFSYTVPGKHWLTHEWLSEVLIYLSVSRLGYAITLGIFLSITLASFGLMQRLLVRLGVSPVAAILLVILGLMMSATYWTVRPQVLSWALVALFISTLFSARRPVWWLVPTMALWANLHLEFVFGLAIVSIWLVSRTWEQRMEHNDFNVLSGGAFLLACAAATLVNPHGLELPLHSLPAAPFLGGGNDLTAISEWASPDFHEPAHGPLLVAILLFVVIGPFTRSRDTFALVLAATFLLMALYSARFQPVFAIAFLPAAGLGLRDVAFLRHTSTAPARSTVNWAIVGIVAVIAAAAIPSLPKAQTGREPMSNGSPYFPQAALEWVKTNEPDANVFAEYTWGGYFVDGLYPQGHVFIDGRSEMYGKSVLDDYHTIRAARPGWQGLLDASHTDVVVVMPVSQIAQELRYAAGWSTELETPNEAVFVRRQP